MVSGRLSAERFDKLSTEYEEEQRQVKQTIIELQNLIDNGEQSEFDLKDFLRNVRKYTDPEELTAEMLNDLVAKIVIHAPDKSSRKRRQRSKFTTRLPESSIFILMIVLLRMVEKSVGKKAKPPNNAEWRYSLSLYRHTT